MACKDCTSENQREVPGELALAFPGVQRVHLAPVHISNKVVVCLDCGYTELVIPAGKLQQLRQGMARAHSNVPFATELSRFL